MGASTSVISGSFRERRGSGQIKLSPGPRLQGGQGHLSKCLRECVVDAADESTRQKLTCYHNLLSDLINGTSSALQPVHKTAQTFILHAQVAVKHKADLAGVFVRTELLEPSLPMHSFAMVAAEVCKTEASRKTIMEAEDRFLSIGQSICERVRASCQPERLEMAVSGAHLSLVAVPIFEYTDGEMKLQFKDVQATLLDGDAPEFGVSRRNLTQTQMDTGVMARRKSNLGSGGSIHELMRGSSEYLANADRVQSPSMQEDHAESKENDSGAEHNGGVGSVLVLCFLAPGDSGREAERAEASLAEDSSAEATATATAAEGSNSVASADSAGGAPSDSTVSFVHELMQDAAGFLKQALEAEARQEHLYQCQRALAASMDIAHMMQQSEDVLKVFKQFQEFIRSVLGVRGCQVFLVDDTKAELWHRSSDDSTIRLQLCEDSLPGRVAIRQETMLHYSPEFYPAMEGSEADMVIDEDIHRRICGGDEYRNMMCVPIMDEVQLVGVVVVIDKLQTDVLEWNRSPERLMHSVSTRGSAQSLVHKLDVSVETKSKPKSPSLSNTDGATFFVEPDVWLLESVALELGTSMETKQLALAYIMNRDTGTDEDLVSLLAMYDPLRRATMREQKKIQHDRTTSSSAMTAGSRAAEDTVSMTSPKYDASLRAGGSTAEQEREEEARLLSWELNVLEEDPDMLIRYSFRFFDQFGLIKKFKLDPEVLLSFLSEVKGRYLPNPFHNWAHAFSVLQGTAIILRCGAMENLKFADVLAALIAAVCHDIGHPGTNNQFQINVGSKLALLYNDVSVLENFHASTTFQVLDTNGCRLLSGFDFQSRMAIRETIVRAILATDISHHFKLVTALKSRLHEAAQRAMSPAQSGSIGLVLNFGTNNRSRRGTEAVHSASGPRSPQSADARAGSPVSPHQPHQPHQPRRLSIVSNGSSYASMRLRRHASAEAVGRENAQPELTVTAKQAFDVSERADRVLLVEAIVHTADLSNPALPFALCRKWNELVVEEFFQQANEEKRLGLPSQPHMQNPPDDEKALANLQLHFIDFVVLPLWSVMRDLFPKLEDRISELEANRQCWREVLQTQQEQAGAATATAAAAAATE